MNLSNQPPKGTADWLPEDFKIRKYIFDVWRRVCESFGYEEYLTPIVESADLYRAKSGEDVGGKELVTFTDQGGRELSIRPEMTPSVTRLVSQIYDAAPKPIRFFSIANFMRNEKPQRGRNREFWQLNCDIFGSDSLNADVEILQLALDLMLAFQPPRDSFELGLNHRALIDDVLNSALPEAGAEQKIKVVRLLDKAEKMTAVALDSALADDGVPAAGRKKLSAFVQLKNLEELDKHFPELAKTAGVVAIREVMQLLVSLGYGGYAVFRPNIIRGFDYYDGLVFEVFDKHPDNNRAMFGGGRYNGLAGIFGTKPFPAVGFAPGDETTKLFLESWGLLAQIKADTAQEIYYLPVLAPDLHLAVLSLAKTLRQEGKQVECGLEVQKITKALDWANKKGLAKVVILGPEEAADRIYKVKDMATGREETFE